MGFRRVPGHCESTVTTLCDCRNFEALGTLDMRAPAGDLEMIKTDSCHVKQIQLAKCGLTGDGTDNEFDYHQTVTLMKVAKVCSP